MKLVIKDSKVFATHNNNQDIENLYPDCSFVIDDGWAGNVGDDYIITGETREKEFNNTFFKIAEYGWYKKQPKGYSSAIESLNTIFNAVATIGFLPANYIAFYTKPDFAKKEQCTEEWLISNSFMNTEMTSEQFGLFYKVAVTLWNTQEH